MSRRGGSRARSKRRRKGRAAPAAAGKPRAAGATEDAAPTSLEEAAGGLEPWARVGYVLVALVLVLFAFLASRPGGRPAIFAYRYGPTGLGIAVALVLAFGLFRSVRVRPVLQRGRLGAWLALGAAFWLASFPLAFPSSHEARPSRVPLELPVAGEWVVRWGGERREDNVLVLTPDRRFGLDLEHIVEDGGDTPGEGGGPRNTSAGEPVFAPVDAGVARVVPAADAPRHLAGLTLVLEIAPGEFLFLAPFEPGSLAVAAGDTVRAGQELGRLAAETRSPFGRAPHLALHLQDTAVPGWGEGIPMRLSGGPGDAGNGVSAVSGGGPRRGDRLWGRVSERGP